MREVISELETGMEFLGITGVEDRLQDVPTNLDVGCGPYNRKLAAGGNKRLDAHG